MQQQDLVIEVATRVLCAIITQDRIRQMPARVEDITHSVQVAHELIRQSGASGLPSFEHDPPRSGGPGVMERKIDRPKVPMEALLNELRIKEASRNQGKRPTHH